MKIVIELPSKNEALITVITMALFLLLTGVFIGLRSEHFLMVALYLVLFFAGLPTRKLALALLPFAIFGISYDWMRICPNYEVNPIDVAGLYNLEKSLFGVMDNGILITPCEYFAAHNWPVADVFAGIFYLCWVPVPILFGLCLYFKKQRKTYLRFALVFLLVNLIGFAGYYIHPAAPPWYAINYGFEPILNTPGNVAGLGRFDAFFSDDFRLYLRAQCQCFCRSAFASCRLYGGGSGICYHRQMQVVCDYSLCRYHAGHLGNGCLFLSPLHH